MPRWVILAAALVGLLVAGCARMPSSHSEVRSPKSAWTPALARTALWELDEAVLLQALAGGVDPEQLAVIGQWITAGDTVLLGPHPEAWEATARAGWPTVRSLLGPYDDLRDIVARVDALLQ